MRRWQLLIVTLLLSVSVACGGVSTEGIPPSLTAPLIATPTQETQPTPVASEILQAVEGSDPDVLSLSVGGAPGAYSFTVTIRSPDTGCDQYADWWEVVSPDGQLIYRRVLRHHYIIQPFTSSGWPVKIQPDETVIVRAHKNSTGYGGMGLRGSVASGFTRVELPGKFGVDLEQREPLPSSCGW